MRRSGTAHCKRYAAFITAPPSGRFPSAILTLHPIQYLQELECPFSAGHEGVVLWLMSQALSYSYKDNGEPRLESKDRVAK